ncbi:MAG: hypothetical protein GXY19_16180 [Phycisphaerae bacterium]|nr:hypothetical protein [Phycisphaerae bacterium]
MKKLLVVALVTMAAGCPPTTLRDVKRELGEGGYALWYPAEEGVEPGQIWITNGKKKHIQQLRPSALSLYGPHAAAFKTLAKTVNANLSLDLSFGGEVLGEIGELGALLSTGTVKEVRLDFGQTRISRLVLGDLNEPNITSRLPAGYLDDLAKVKTLDHHVLVTAVVTSSGLKYIFTCDDTSKLQANAPAISELIGADFELNVSSSKKATWEIPTTDVLAIGVAFGSGDVVRLRDQDVKAQMPSVESTLLMLKNTDLRQLMESHP